MMVGTFFRIASAIEESLNEQIDEFDDENALSKIREKRLMELRRKAAEVQAKESAQHGMYTDIPEKSFLELVTNTKLVVAHFYHTGFNRCRILDEHLERLAPRHFHTKFIKCNVEEFPFFVEKLNIRVLPTIACFRNGVCVDRVVGFDELGETDDFDTPTLEVRLGLAGMVKRGGDNPLADFDALADDTLDEDTVLGARTRAVWSTIPLGLGIEEDEDIDFDA